jgi:hypothetical protein
MLLSHRREGIMKQYKRLNGDSGVTHYEWGTDHITVQFVDGTRYRYSYAIPGRKHVEAMKKLARDGKGLSTYISVYVRDKYESKS